jgi:hypothetical protein
MLIRGHREGNQEARVKDMELQDSETHCKIMRLTASMVPLQVSEGGEEAVNFTGYSCKAVRVHVAGD